MAKNDNVMLEVNINRYTNKEGKPVEYVQYGVTLNGIFLELKPSDNTVRQVLKNHFDL